MNLFKKSLIAGMSAAMLLSVGTFSSNTADAASKSVVRNNKITRIYNKQGALVTNRALTANSDWLMGKVITLDGLNYDQVATNEYVKDNEVTKLAQADTTPNVSWDDQASWSDQYRNSQSAIQTGLLNAINTERAARGTAPLKMNSGLNNVAIEMSAEWMNEANGHGKMTDNPWPMFKANGVNYGYGKVGESFSSYIGFGDNSEKIVSETMKELKSSNITQNYDNLMNPAFTDIGIGISCGTENPCAFTAFDLAQLK